MNAVRRNTALLVALAAGSLLASAPVQADVYWTGGTTWNSGGDWNTAADGVSGTYRLPVAGDMAIFSATNVLYDKQVTTLDVAFSVLGLTFQNTGYAVTIGPDYPSVNTLTLGTSGITMNSGAGAVTIGDALALSGGQTWTNNSSNFLAIGGNITTGSNNLTLAGTGNTFLSGNIATNGNTLTFNGTGSTTLGGNITMASGANLTFAGGGSATINGNIVTTGAGSLSFNGTGSTTVNGVIGSGSGTVYINSGTVTFGNANTYTGPTQVGATLIVANASGSATGSGNVIVTSTGTLEGSGIITGAVSVSGGGHLDPHPNSTATGTGQLTLTTSTSTTLTLQTGSIVDFNIGATSDLVQVNGKLSIPAALSAVTLKVNALDGFGAGTYELFGYTSLVNTFNHNYIAITSSTPAIPLAPSFTYTTSNDAVNKRINLVVTVKPTLTWSATNGTTWDTSSLNWNGGATAFTAGSPVEFDDNVPADPSNTVTLSNLYTLNPLSVVVNTNTTYTFTGNGFLQDVTSTVPMTLIKNGTGKLTIGSNLANNFTGGTTINGGTIAISTANSLGDASGPLTINAGTLEATTNITSTRNITLGAPTAAIAVDSSQNFTSSGIISGAYPLNATGTGTLTLSGANNYTGGTNIQSGTLAVGAANALPAGGTITIGGTGTSGTLDLDGIGLTVASLATAGTASNQTITNNSNLNATLTYAGGNSTFGGRISDGTSGKTLLAMVSGTLSLTGSSNYTGATSVSGGTLSLDGVGAITASPVTISGTGILAQSVPNALSGTASLNVNGATATVSQSNNYTGGTNILSGTLMLGNNNVLPTAGTVTIGSSTGSGTLDLNGYNQTVFGLATAGSASSQTITNNSTTANSILTFAGGNSTYAGTINNGPTNTVALNVTSGTLTLSGTTSNYSGGTTIGGSGTVVVGRPGASGAGTVNLTGGSSLLQFPGGGINLVSGFSGTWSTVGNANGGVPTISADQTTLTMNTNVRNTTHAAWYTTQVPYGTFIAQFTYTAAAGSNPDGMTFALQTAGTTQYGGFNSPGLGYGAGGQGGTVPTPSAAFGWSIASQNANSGNAVAGGSNGTFAAFNALGGGVTLSSGDPLQFTITGSSSSNQLSYTITDLSHTQDTTTGIVTLTGTLASLLGNSGNAYIGFTGASTGGLGQQTISNFSFTTGLTGTFTSANNVTVIANSTIDVSYSSGPVSMGTLAIGGNTLNVTNLAGGGATLTLGATTLSGNPTFAPAAGVNLTLGALNDGGTARTITINGAGAVTLNAAATSLVNGTTVVISSGTLKSNNPTALGGFAVVNVAAGAAFSLGASQTINALTDQGTPGAVVFLNGNALTIGTADNLSSTFSGTIADGTGAGSLIKAGTGTLTLNGNSTYTGSTAIQSGAILLGANNALPSGTTVTLGAASSNGMLDLRGFNQQVAGLGLGAGANASTQTITSSVGTGTLTYAGGTTTFGGVISGNVALALNSGSLTLTGSSNYAGGTTLAGGTLIVANGAGSATGPGAVAVNSGGTLSGTGSIGGAVMINYGGILAPHTTPTGTATLTVGSLTVNDGSIFNFNLGAASDLVLAGG